MLLAIVRCFCRLFLVVDGELSQVLLVMITFHSMQILRDVDGHLTIKKEKKFIFMDANRVICCRPALTSNRPISRLHCRSSCLFQ
jgi:hypothetical protein